jgi:PAS domain S-box-containing protein
MTHSPTHPDPSDQQSTRALAESSLALHPAGPAAQGLESPEPQRLLHELQVHQIELEMQNEELRQTRDALGASRSRYADLYDQAPVGYCSVNEAGLIIQANRTLASLLGVGHDALASRSPFSNFVLSGDQVIWYRLRTQPLHSGAPQSCELRMRKPGASVAGSDSATLWVQLSVMAAQDEAGAPLKHIAVTDINERKTAEIALRKSEELLSLFLKHTPVHTFFKEVNSTESRVLRASDSFQQMIGLTGQDMLGKTMAELFSPELAAKITADDWAVVSRGEPVTLEEELNGRSYTTVKFPIALAGTTLLAGFTLDVTERKRSEAALREGSENLSSILCASLDGYWQVDSLGKLIDVNASYCRLSGYMRDELLGMHIADLEVQESPVETEGHIQRIIVRGGDLFETRHRRKDATIWNVEVSTTYRSAPSGGFFVFLRDITERKRAQKELLQQNAELTLFNIAAVDRELVMIGLKQEVNTLSRQIGQQAPYDVGFLDTQASDPT